MTLEQAISTFGVEVDEHHQRELEIPIIDGDQAQGDVMVLKADTPAPTDEEIAANLVPQAGIAVVRGENGGNTHLLLASGTVAWFPSPTAGESVDDLVLGTAYIAEGSVGYLAHPEHAYSGLAAGSYTISRQREAGELNRYVAD
jgi:hypothetical protein